MAIGLIYDRFLPLSETFLLHEWRALHAAKLPLCTFALRPLPVEQACTTAAEMAQALPVRLNAAALLSKAGLYVRHPVRGTALGCAMVGAAIVAHPNPLGHLWRANAVFGLIRQLRGNNITHLHASFLGLPATLAWCAHRMTGISYSISAHARDIWSEDFATADKVARADRVFVCNQAARVELLRRYPEQAGKIVLAPHGIPIEDAPASPEAAAAGPPPQAWTRNARFKLLAVGRLVEKKGFEYLIAACDILRQHQLDYGLAIVGHGPLLQSLGAKIQALNLTDRVDLLGAQPAQRVQALMKQADLLVVPSAVASDQDRDGVPNVILEAFAAGLPVLGTPVGGIPEVVLPEKTGFLALDYFPSALIAGIHQALETPSAARQALAINAKFWLHENREITQCTQPMVDYFRAK